MGSYVCISICVHADLHISGGLDVCVCAGHVHVEGSVYTCVS